MKKITKYGLILIIFGILVYLSRPVLNFNFYGLPFIVALVSGGAYLLEFTKKKARKIEKLPLFFPVVFYITLAYMILVPMFTTWTIFHSDEYRDLIGEVKIGENFTSHVAPISNEEIRIVDSSMAHRLGDKVLGSKPSLGSQVELGKFHIQKINNKLYWVAPLLHSGFFKWNKNSEGTTGYVMVSATNERDVKLVQTTNSEPIYIKYQPNAFFRDNLSRHIYFNGYSTKGYTDFSFEVDDSGKPFWVVTLFDKKLGFSGNDATGVILVNPENGEINEYAIEETPTWVDRIQPSNFILDQLKDWGELVEGYWNFSNENKLTTTPGISLVYGSDNTSYWYTGLTSVGSDEGTVGFVLVNTRTKQTVWYKQTGATETAAQMSAMGKVQEKGYLASFPITYNINGIPTYVMSLKDKAGLVKMIAMVSVEDFSIVGVATNVNETLRTYKNALNSKGSTLTPNSMIKSYKIKTTIDRISTDVRNGNTFYYLVLSDFKNKIFIGSSLVSNQLPISLPKDTVLVEYDDGTNKMVDIVSFNNLQYTLEKSSQQIKPDISTDSIK